MQRIKIISKRNVVILALMAILSIMISAFFIVDSANNVYAASDAGSAGVHGGSVPAGPANDLHWFYGDLGGNADPSGSSDSIKTFLQRKGTDTSDTSMTFSAWITTAYDNAIKDCNSNSAKTGHKCTSPRVVAVAYQTVKGDMYPATAGQVSSSVNMNQVKQCLSINIKGNSVSTCANMTGGSIADQLVSHTSTKSFVSIVVLANWQYQQKGWKQNWSKTSMSDVKSEGADQTATLGACPVYYQVHAEGTDGHTLGMSSNVKTVLTPYGELWNVLNQGKGSWTDKEGGTHTWMQADNQPQKDYGSDPAAATARAVKDIRWAHDVACRETWKMKITYDLVSDGGDAGKQLNKQFAKGGQYKLVKQGIKKTINVRQLNLKYYHLDVTWWKWGGWTQCNKGDKYATPTGTQSCSYIGQSKPAAPSDLVLSTTGSSDKGKYTTGSWTLGDSATIKNAVNSAKANTQVYGRTLRGVFSGSDVGLGYNNANGSGIRWRDPAATKKNEWIFGNSNGYINGSHFYAVANELQSYVAVAMQDFLNMNCNRSDFEKIKQWADARGILDPNSVKSTKYNGYFATKIMTGSSTEPEAQQKMWRALTIIKSLNGGTYPGLTSLPIEWSGVDKNGNAVSGDAAGDADPVYTKECPYDCTATPAKSDTKLPDHIENGDFSYPAAKWTKNNHYYSSSDNPANGKYWSHWTYDGKGNSPDYSSYNGSWDPSQFAWHTTQGNGLVEIDWDDLEENQYAEIVAEEKNTALYQDIASTPGAVYVWTLKHASQNREHLDKMSVLIGAPGHEEAQEARRITVNGNGDKLGNVGTVIATKVFNNDDTSHRNQWETYTGTYVVPAGQTTTRFSFKSVDSVDDYTGNAIDDISFSAKYPSTPINVRTKGASDADKAKNSYGIKVHLPENTGAYQETGGLEGFVNTADAVAFRNNENAQLDLDVWYPISSKDISYNGTAATTTTIVRNDGTPWKINGSVLTKLQGSSDGGKTWTDINFGSSPGTAVNQWSGSSDYSHNGLDPDTNKPYPATYSSIQIPSNITNIRIRSPWASDKGNELKFNIKWEYLADNQVSVVSKWEVNGDGTAWGNNAVNSLSTTTTQVDGKCEAQYHNPGQSYVDHEAVAQRYTGRGVQNDIDTKFRDNTNLIGWFGVTFTRATSE